MTVRPQRVTFRLSLDDPDAVIPVVLRLVTAAGGQLVALARCDT